MGVPHQQEVTSPDGLFSLDIVAQVQALGCAGSQLSGWLLIVGELAASQGAFGGLEVVLVMPGAAAPTQSHYPHCQQALCQSAGRRNEAGHNVVAGSTGALHVAVQALPVPLSASQFPAMRCIPSALSGQASPRAVVPAALLAVVG